VVRTRISPSGLSEVLKISSLVVGEVWVTVKVGIGVLVKESVSAGDGSVDVAGDTAEDGEQLDTDTKTNMVIMLPENPL